MREGNNERPGNRGQRVDGGGDRKSGAGRTERRRVNQRPVRGKAVGDERPSSGRSASASSRRMAPDAGGQKPTRGPDRPFRDRRAPERRTDPLRKPRSGLLNVLRESPVRNGLIGLAVAGTAAPIALNHYRNALRTDTTHEAVMSGTQPEATEEAVASTLEGMEKVQEGTEAAREAAIAESIEKYAEFGLDRALAEQIYDAAAVNAIDPEVAYGLVRAESSFKNTSTSEVGAIGLTQLMPGTARGLQPGITGSELREPATNLRIGFKYLRELIDKYGGDEDLALLAYNRGPGTVDKALRKGSNPDNGYADFVRGKAGHGHTLYTRG